MAKVWKVAEILRKAYDAIKAWFYPFAKHGMDCLCDKPRSSRPPRIKNLMPAAWLENPKIRRRGR